MQVESGLNMNPRDIKVIVRTSPEIDTPYAQVNASSQIELRVDKEGKVCISSDNPIGVKFMGMTIATLSSIEISDSGEVLNHSINAPFLVKAQVEREICKSVSKIPFGIVETYLRRAGIDSGSDVSLVVNSDKSVGVCANKELALGRGACKCAKFCISPDGKVGELGLDLSSPVWEKFQSSLS